MGLWALSRRFAHGDKRLGVFTGAGRESQVFFGCGETFCCGETIDAYAAPSGARLSFPLTTLHGFANARLQDGLNNFAPAALGSGGQGKGHSRGRLCHISIERRRQECLCHKCKCIAGEGFSTQIKPEPGLIWARPAVQKFFYFAGAGSPRLAPLGFGIACRDSG